MGKIIFSIIILFALTFSVSLNEAFASDTAPIVDAGPDTTIDEGDTFLYVGTFTDPDDNVWSGTVDYGDGSGIQPLVFDADKTFTLEHTYENDGTFTVTVTIDDGTASSIDSTVVTVNNIVPSYWFIASLLMIRAPFLLVVHFLIPVMTHGLGLWIMEKVQEQSPLH